MATFEGNQKSAGVVSVPTTMAMHGAAGVVANQTARPGLSWEGFGSVMTSPTRLVARDASRAVVATADVGGTKYIDWCYEYSDPDGDRSAVIVYARDHLREPVVWSTGETRVRLPSVADGREDSDG